MSRQGTVSRAELLRLLAACPDMPSSAAACLLGLQPLTAEPQSSALPLEEPAIYETQPAENLQICRLERFWHLYSREPLPTRSVRQPVQAHNAELPVELRHVRSLRAKELHGSVAVTSRFQKTPATGYLFHLSAHLRPFPRHAAQPICAATRESAEPPAVLALKLLQTGGALERSQAEWLEHFLLRFVRTWFDRRKDADLIAYARQLLELLPDSFRRQYTSAAFLYGVVHRDMLRQGAVISPEYRPEAVLAVVQDMLPSDDWLLIQEGEEIFLVNSPESGICLLKGSRIAGLRLSSDILLLHRNGQTETAPVQSSQPLCSLRSTGQFRLQTRNELLCIQSRPRPAWAAMIGRNSRELFAELAWLGRSCRLYWQVPAAGGSGGWRSCHGPVSTDRFGLFAYIGFYGRVMQRFRWIEPSRFLMGSPLDEPEREAWGKETQHEVTLRKGFWLADTTVSQELWQFVMRNNPAHFQNRDRPVENVSWQDAQFFLQRLNAMVPGLVARLPTEAEWEYACRAGSSTPFSFGSHITPEQVNYNGSYPYQGGQKGQFRRQSVAVGSLPANAWGLYEMHGNLWEWCQDWWQEDLGCDATVDPCGPEQGEFRVARGGSWFLSGKGVRSAVRGRFAPDFRNDRVGFRIARDHETGAESSAPVLEPKVAPPSSFLRRFFGKG